MVNFYGEDGEDVVHLVFAVETPEEAFVFAHRVMESGVLDELATIDGFELQALEPRPISEGEMDRFIREVTEGLQKPEAEGGGA